MSKTVKSSRGLLIFGLFWTAFSSIFLIIGIKMGYDAFDRSAWPEAPCSVTSFNVAASPNTDPPFQPTVQYTYQWEGKTYTGDRVWADKTGEDNYEDLAELVEQYRNGSLSKCHVNPDLPEESVLLVGPGELWGGLIFALVGGVFVAVGIGMVIYSRKQKKAENAALSSKHTDDNAPKTIMIPFFGIFALAGIGVLIGVVIPQWKKYNDAKGWVETPAKIIWSRVESHTDDDGTTYSVDIFYRYEFEGKEYKSNTVGFMSGSSSGREGKEEKVRANPPGKTVTCYVNPDKPWLALLERDLGWWALFALFPLPFIGIGVGGLWWMLKKRAKAKQEANRLGRRSGPFPRHSASSSDIFHPSSRQRFSPGSKRTKWFIGAILIALFWNGITSVFVWQAVKSWQRGNPEWFLTIFIIPFVLIGLGLIGHIFYRLFALFNPSPTITLKPGSITLGKPAKLKWETQSGAHRMKRFAIYLVGEEEAEYQRGTDTVKDTETFYEQALIDTQDPRKSTRGSANIELPVNSMGIMPSWKSKHNSIKWSLHIKGDISFWPDVSDRYDITVHPADFSSHH